MFIQKISLFILFIFVGSCSGYRFRNPSNPLSQYNIHSVAVPVFQNRSSLPEVGGIFTDAIVRELCKFPNLRVIPGNSNSADAVLLGIVTSKQYIRKTIVQTREKDITAETMGEETIGKRRDFRVPADSSVALDVSIILIKNPTAKELELIGKTANERVIYQNPKIIFNTTYALSANFQREVYPEVRAPHAESGRSVNYVKNRGMLYLKEKEMAESLASSFRETGLYVF